MARLIIIISGRRDAGKNTFANLLAIEWMKRCGAVRFCPTNIQRPRLEGQNIVYDEVMGTDPVMLRRISLETGIGSEETIRSIGFRVHAYATLLKLFMRDTIGLPSRWLFGTRSEKESLTHLKWNDLSLLIRFRNRKKWYHWMRSGRMSAREAMQVFGTDIMRQWDYNVWVRAAVRYAILSTQKVIAIADCRFPNEADFVRNCRVATTLGGTMQARIEYVETHGLPIEILDSDIVIRTVRLLRRPNNDKHKSETALNDYPLDRFDVVIPADIDMDGMVELAYKYAEKWFNEAHLL